MIISRRGSMYKNQISGIYRIINTLDNKFYIGNSVNIYSRWGLHKHLLNNNKHGSIKLQRAWNKYGEQNFRFEIIELCDPVRDTLIFLEQKYLDLKPAYNTCYFASSTLGFRHSEESKKKMSDFRKTQKGKHHHTEETKQMMSERQTGRFVSEQTKDKFRKPMIMLDILTDEVIREFKSMGEAGLFVGNYNRRVEIKKAAQGKRKTAYGYKWKYKVI